MSEEECGVYSITPGPDQTSIWKEFKIEKCKECGKTPNLHRDFDYTDDRRYRIHCCGRTAGSAFATACIVTWNRMQEEENAE